MGWMTLGSQQPPRTDYEPFLRRDDAVKAGGVAQVEDVEYPTCSKDIRNVDLPIIPAETVKLRDGKKGSRLCVSSASHVDI